MAVFGDVAAAHSHQRDESADVDIAECSGKELKKRKHNSADQRMRLSELQKAEIILHYQKHPKISQRELIAWAHETFSMKKQLSPAAMSILMKQKERLIEVAASETSQYVLSLKTKQAIQYPD